MTRNYRRLTFIERIEIYTLLAFKQSLLLISRTLGKNKSTISCEGETFCEYAYHYIQGELGFVYNTSNRP